MSLFLIIAAGLAALFLLFAVLIHIWRSTPHGKLEWKLAVILRIYRSRERHRKEQVDDIREYRAMSNANMLRFIDTYTGSAAAEDLCIPSVAKQQHGPGSTAGSIPARLFTPRQFPPAGSTVAGGGSGRRG